MEGDLVTDILPNLVLSCDTYESNVLFKDIDEALSYEIAITCDGRFKKELQIINLLYK